MKCRSCKEDVPSKFTHAISMNVCPLCGSEIMDSKLQEVLIDLKKCFSNFNEFEEEISDWLFSNYSFKKVSPKDNTQLIFDEKTSKFVKQDESGNNSMVSVFAKRAGVPIHSQSAIDFIKGKNNIITDPSEFDKMEADQMIDDEGLDPLNANDAQMMRAAFKDVGRSQELEIQKLKRLQSQGGGAFRRSE